MCKITCFLKETKATCGLHGGTNDNIMWHDYSKESDAYWFTEKFYNLPKEERDAVVEFVNSI